MDGRGEGEEEEKGASSITHASLTTQKILAYVHLFWSRIVCNKICKQLFVCLIHFTLLNVGDGKEDSR